MPLEQIGASLQLLHRSDEDGPGSGNGNGNRSDGGVAASSSTASSNALDVESKGQDRNADDDVTWVSTSSSFTGAMGAKFRQSIQHNDDTILRKLGGVGGVKRSGSAKYASRSISSRSTFSSSLSNSPENDTVHNLDYVGDEAESEDDDETKENIWRSSSGSQITTDLPHSPQRISSYPSPQAPPRSPSFQAMSGRRADTLTLTAAAQAKNHSIDEGQPANFVPPEPRRHTGSFALRSRSALSRTLGSTQLNFGNGQGRAAARRAATPNVSDATRDVDESASLTDGTFQHASSPSFAPPNWQPSTQDVSPRTRTIDFVLSPTTPFQTSNDSTVLAADSLLSPLAKASLDANYFSIGAGPDATMSSGGSSDMSSPRQKSAARSPGSVPPPLSLEKASSRTSLSSPPPSASTGSFVASANAPRPSIIRSSTSNVAKAGVNVLRTPTTEEWSRFLLKQGVNPSQLIQTKDGTIRSRSSTSRSVQQPNSRRKTSERTEDALNTLSVVEKVPPSHSADDLIEIARQTNKIDRRNTQDRSSASGSDENLSDGMDEHMFALHEAISRPPSRLGTPVSSENGDDEHIDASPSAYEREPRRARWPSRETAAALMGYPLPPSGEQRNIDDFVIIDDIGRGAYGLVKKARVRDELTGEAAGPELAIKYIIKSRILADCWRRHKVLGPIPVEIHVLDQLRRLPCQLPSEPLPWSAERLYDLPSSVPAAAVDGDHLIGVGHPALCMMVDFFEDHEFYYMVMPRFGTGQDLFDYIESQPQGLSTKHVRCIFGQLADGLNFLHQNNIVHRDVKDENVILDGHGHIQLIDFGSAAHVVNTRNGGGRLFDTFSGTLDYAAAEILRGEKYGGKEQDVWALGVVGYVLLCGDCPFWNGEEAMHGLQIDSRAFNVLSERCRPLTKQDVTVDEDAVHTPNTATTAKPDWDRDGFTGLRAVDEEGTSPTINNCAEIDVLRRRVDMQGQPDGGGRLEDAADLIMQCLQLNYAERPTMEQICKHRFLNGTKGGWSGLCGWRQG